MLGKQLDSILKVFSNTNDSMILWNTVILRISPFTMLREYQCNYITASAHFFGKSDSKQLQKILPSEGQQPDGSQQIMEGWEFWPRIPQLLQKLLLHHHYKLNTKTDGAQGFGFFSERFTCNKMTSKEFASKTKGVLYSSKCLFCFAIKQSRGRASSRILILWNGRHWETWKHVPTVDYEEDGI